MRIKALVIGKGGREHALVRALRLSPSVSEIHALPGSDGIAREAVAHLNSEDTLGVVRRTGINLVVVGPETDLVAGLADGLRDAGVAVIGPGRLGARLEGSKVFAKEFMQKAGIPTGRAVVVDGVESVQQAMPDFSPPYVLKADGLAAGKGVWVCQDRDELLAAAQALFVDRCLGAAGDQALLEEFLSGKELSYLILTNGKTWEPLPLARDHKRLLEGDQGPNTGGMGVVAPITIAPETQNRITEEIIEPTLKELRRRQMPYLGVLYFGLMLTPDGPKLLEYNVRFGDPEAQVIMPLLDGDWGEIFHALATGRVVKLAWKPLATACVVLASPGYPEQPQIGDMIAGQPLAESASSYFLHAGTKRQGETDWVTAGGRVLNAIGIGSDPEEALRHAYHQAEQVSWPGLQIRKDIHHL